MIMRSRLLSVLTVMLLLGGTASDAQQTSVPLTSPQSPSVFKSDVNLIEVHAVVTDARGNFVGDLTKDEFEIYEDGRLQSASVLQLVDVPITRTASTGADIESDIRSSRRSFDGRVYVIVLDDLHTMALRSHLVRDAAKRFIDRHLGPEDLAAVVYTSGRRDAAQELTNSRRLLRAAVERFQGQKLPSASAERLAVHQTERDMARQSDSSDGSSESTNKAASERVDDPFDAERGFKARRALELVKDVAQWMSGVQGRRKALLLFSEGIDYDIYDVFNNRAASSIVLDARDAIAAAQRANVSVYAVDPRGLTQLGDESITIASLSDDATVDYGTSRGFQRELLLAQESLMWLAEETGGLAVVRSNDISGGLARITADNSRYYMLGYVSDSKRAPSHFRKIEVRVKRPALKVRARRGYLPEDPKVVAKKRESEAKAGTSPALVAALNNPLPLGDLPVRVTATSIKGSDKSGTVLIAIEVDGAALPYKQQNDRFVNTLEFSIVAADHAAKVQDTDRQEINLKLKPETRDKLAASGVRVLSRLDVPPGRYQIRVGVHESVGGAIATVPYDIEVPDYAKAPFVLSGLMVAAPSAAGMMTAAPDPAFKELFPIPPAASRSFLRTDILSVLAELYDRSTPHAHAVDVAVSIRAATDGRTVFSSRESRQVAAGSARTERYRAEIPLKDLTAGEYVLRVETTSRAGDERAAREIPFEVRETPRAITF